MKWIGLFILLVLLGAVLLLRGSDPTACRQHNRETARLVGTASNEHLLDRLAEAPPDCTPKEQAYQWHLTAYLIDDPARLVRRAGLFFVLSQEMFQQNFAPLIRNDPDLAAAFLAWQAEYRNR